MWLPFATPCADFVANQFPNLVAFGTRCAAAGAGQPPAPPAPPPAAGSVYYAEGTLTMNNADIGSSAKRQNRFKQSLRADVADAIHLQQESILISALSANSVTLEIFGSQADVQAAVTALSSQLSDPSSSLLQGSVSSALTPNQHPSMQVTAMGGGGGGGTAGPSTLTIRIDDNSDGTTPYSNSLDHWWFFPLQLCTAVWLLIEFNVVWRRHLLQRTAARKSG